ncbi:MAG: JAB domain-containing protein [bacterium]
MYRIQTGLEARKRAMVRDGQTISITTPAGVAKECSDIAHSSQEAFIVLTLNAKNKLIDKHIVSIGLVDASLVHPRELFRKAIMDSANAIIILHNHPSGEVTPSAEDIRITKQIVEAGKIVDIKLMDSIIVGVDDTNGEVRHCSLRESGLVSFL